MKYLKHSAVGVATAVATAVTVSLVPGADATSPGSTTSTVQSGNSSKAGIARVAADSGQGSLTSAVSGRWSNGVVLGTFAPKRFIKRGHQDFAAGVLHAVLRRNDGTLKGRANSYITIPVKTASAAKAQRADVTPQATCQILNLVLGPLDLHLLGLNVHLNRVVLHITATTGPGNLLGNLLCAVAGLLDGGPLSQLGLLRLANVLNRILNILRL